MRKQYQKGEDLLMAQKTDTYYITKIQKGHAASYAFLVERYKLMAYKLAFRVVQNNEDAEEVTQDAFVKAFAALSKFKKEAKFSTWLYRIVYNTAVSKIRKKKVIETTIDDDLISDENIAETYHSLQHLKQQEQKKFIQQALTKLSTDESALITLFYLNENSIDEIRQIMSLSIANIKVKLHRARKKLYTELNAMLENELQSIL